MAARKSGVASSGPLNFLKLLSRERVPFVLVGGSALVLHGIPRSTLDFDIFIPSREPIPKKLFSLARKAGLTSRQSDLFRMAGKPDLLIGQWVSFRDKSGRDIIDFFFETPSRFSALKLRAVIRKAQGYSLRVASLNDLERMKKAARRPIDLADIALIRERRKLK